MLNVKEYESAEYFWREEYLKIENLILLFQRPFFIPFFYRIPFGEEISRKWVLFLQYLPLYFSIVKHGIKCVCMR